MLRVRFCEALCRIVGEYVDREGGCNRPLSLCIRFGIQMVFADCFEFHVVEAPPFKDLNKIPINEPKSNAFIGSFLMLRELSVGETGSAFCASSLKNFPAVGGSHSFSEAVLFISLPFLGLICSLHDKAPPCLNFSV